MSVFLDISAALDGHLERMDCLPDGVAWENYDFEPSGGTLWIRPKLLPGETVQSSLGTDGTDLSNGVYQIDIFSKAGMGKNEAVMMADTIADRFKRGTELIYNSRVITIRNVSRLAGTVNAEGWFQVTIEIIYRTFTQART